MILTDEDISQVYQAMDSTVASSCLLIARAIEAVVLSKLAEQAGEPVAKVISHARMTSQSTTLDRPIRAGVNLYTEAQYLAAQQRTAEACAKLAVSVHANGSMRFTHRDEILEAIRNGEWREYL